MPEVNGEVLGSVGTTAVTSTSVGGTALTVMRKLPGKGGNTVSTASPGPVVTTGPVGHGSPLDSVTRVGRRSTNVASVAAVSATVKKNNQTPSPEPTRGRPQGELLPPDTQIKIKHDIT